MIEPDPAYVWQVRSLDHFARGPLNHADKQLLRAVLREQAEAAVSIGKREPRQRDLDRVVALTKLALKLARLWPEAAKPLCL